MVKGEGRMKESSTLKYIAKELGVSVSTVSRALNGKSVVKEATRDRILSAAKKYNYVPNEVARSLQKSSTNTIAVVLPDVSETFFGTIVKELERVVAREGYMIILADTHEKADKERKYLDMLFKRRIDALVLATVDLGGDSVKTFIERGVPVVFIDNVPSISDIDSITVDNVSSGHIAIDYLCERGHTRIATIIGSKEETTGTERLLGYKNALAEHGIDYSESLVAFGDYKHQSGYDAMNELLSRREECPFTAVYVTSEKMTYGALKAIRDRGLSVPEDISVVGFDIHNHTDDRRQKITTICQPEELIGSKVGELLVKRLSEEKSDFSAERKLLQPYLEKGDTVKKL